MACTVTLLLSRRAPSDLRKGTRCEDIFASLRLRQVHVAAKLSQCPIRHEVVDLSPSTATAVHSRTFIEASACGSPPPCIAQAEGAAQEQGGSQPRCCASSQRQALASRAEQIAAQLEGSTLCREYTVCTDDQALLGEGGQACTIRHVHIGGSVDLASPVTPCTAASPLVCICVHSRSAGHARFGCAAGFTTTGKGGPMPSRCSRRDRVACRLCPMPCAL